MKLKKTIKFVFLISVILLAVMASLFYLYFDRSYAGKIYPNIYVGGINVGDKTVLEAKQLMSDRIATVNQEGINVYYNTDNVTIYPVNSFSDGEMVEVLIDFDTDTSIDQAFLIGRSGNFFDDIKNRVDLFLFRNYIRKDFQIKLNSEKIVDTLRSKFFIYESSDAFYFFDENGNLAVESEYNGKKIDYDKTVSLLRNNLSQFNFSSIPLVTVDKSPIITKGDCLKTKDAVEYVLNLAPIVLAYEGREWSIEKNRLLSFVNLEKVGGNNNEGKIIVGLSKEKIASYLKENIAPQIDVEPIMPKFTIENGKVKNFKPGISGVSLDIESVSSLLAKIPIDNTNILDLTVKKTTAASDVKGENGDVLGIRDVIGQSSLSFSGSTVSRAKNIANASNAINGILIKPNEEFSTIKNLVPIDGTNGYSKEIVINGKDINYEYGGGVCHLSTTFFRAVLDSGLPITMRQNHSYNMPYYYPAGTDASVYDPSPDFRFINDTGNYVLIQSKIVGSELVIQLWGTNDGRNVMKGKSVVYNIIKPKPSKMTPTDTLPTGQVKCSYTPYSGADAYFDYKVEYKDGTIKERRFNSHYVPRQGVCLIGI
jgi:vancomycin resistance protein YoaR